MTEAINANARYAFLELKSKPIAIRCDIADTHSHNGTY